MRGTATPWLVVIASLMGGACDREPAAAPSTPKSENAPTLAATPQSAPAQAARLRWAFDDLAAGTLPAGWTVASGRWQVTDQKALRQVAENETRIFNVVLADRRARDVALRVRFRAVSGKIDRGGGLVWRALDGKNYYIARYNPLEKNLRLYTVKDGERTQLAGVDVDLAGETWNTLEVRMVGDQFEGSLNGKKHLAVRDVTFAEAGAIGLWTKADAVTDFDDLELEMLGSKLDAQAIGSAVGTKASIAPDGVVRVAWPRTDVQVTVDRMRLEPAAGLGSWAAFSAHGAGAMLMGDTVVFEDEVSAGMDAAFAAGLEVTAIHNHFFFDRPKVYFMHVGGLGDAVELGRGVRKVWDAIRVVRKQSPAPADTFGGETPTAGPLDAKAIAKIVGHPAETLGSVVKITIGREGGMHGTRVGASMGLTTWAAFSGSDALAAVAGDFIMTEAEVQPVLRALRKANLHVVALHNHMVGGEPFFYFTHFWGKAPAAALAQGLRRVLDAQAAAGPTQKH